MLSNEESQTKWSLISLLEQLKKLKIYSTEPTPLKELIKHKRASIVSLKGVDPFVSEAVVAGLLRDLFEARKKEEIPPCFIILEEAHNWCPERSFGETRSSKVIRTIAAEGRKFGMGLCVISQRPAKIDKNVVSQCTTQIILKMTNPNDIKSVMASSEGMSSEMEQEIERLNIGTCLLTGVIDIPLKVNIRPRISKHGGESVDITLAYEDQSRKEDVKSEIKQDKKVEPKTEMNLEKKESLISEQSKPEPVISKVEEPKVESVEVKVVEPVIEKVEVKKEQPKKESKKKEGGKESEFLTYCAPELSMDDVKTLLETKEVSIELVPAELIKIKLSEGKEAQLLVDRVHKKIIKSIFPFEGMDFPQAIQFLSSSERKVFKQILKWDKPTFTPAELLSKSEMMFNEISHSCDLLFTKKILVREDKGFALAPHQPLKILDTYSCIHKPIFDEVSFDKKLEPQLSSELIDQVLSFFGQIENKKELFLLKYVAK
jgi:hypothetical protein